jgi:hypothetical protein
LNETQERETRNRMGPKLVRLGEGLFGSLEVAHPEPDLPDLPKGLA